MESKNQNLEQQKEKQPYETPQLARHGSAEQLTGMAVSAFSDDRTDFPSIDFT